MSGHVLLLALVITFVGSEPSPPEDIPNREAIEFSAIMSAEKAEQQVELVKAAVRTGSCIKLAEFVRFPLAIYQSGHKPRHLWNRTAFCRYYSSIFDEVRTKAFLEQKLEETPIGYRGLSFRKSGIWLQPACPGDSLKAECPRSEYQLKLVTVNL